MPKIGVSKPRRHANAAKMNRYLLRGFQLSSERAVTCCETVACPKCRSAKGWPCYTINGNASSTPHSARWEEYGATLNAATD